MYSHLPIFTVAVVTGSALMLAGAAGVITSGARTAVHSLATAAGAIAALVAAWAVTDDVDRVAQAAGLAAATLVGGPLLVSAPVARAVLRPPVGWGLVAALGLAIIIATGAAIDRTAETAVDADMRDIEDMASGRPPVRFVRRATTDRGTQIDLLEPAEEIDAIGLRRYEIGIVGQPAVRDRVIRCGPAAAAANCHGWVFTGDRYWVRDREVETILTENGYDAVGDARPGDLAIYRTVGTVCHTAVVRYTAEGLPVLVEGKWGAAGVFLHAADDSCYGSDVTYYRSNRTGHLLAGVAD